MSHGLFDCIGLPLVGWDAVTGFIADHSGEIHGEHLTDETFVGRWRDPSGAQIAVAITGDSVGAERSLEAVAGYDCPRRTSVRFLGLVAGSDLIDVYAIDGDGEVVTRVCAQSAQWRELGAAREGDALTLGISALARSVEIFSDEDEFSQSSRSYLGTSEPAVGEDGEEREPLKLAVGSFIPVGLFGDEPNPMALLTGEVQRADTLTNVSTGRDFVVAMVWVLETFSVFACWPADVAPCPAQGNVVRLDAFLTATVASE